MGHRMLSRNILSLRVDTHEGPLGPYLEGFIVIFRCSFGHSLMVLCCIQEVSEHCKRTRIDDQLKRDAVRLMTEGGQKTSQVSRDLGGRVSLLQRWRRRIAGGTGKQAPTGNDKSVSADSAELQKLRKGSAQMKQERKIPIKALAVFLRRPA